jgi:hypothetical protein
MLEHLSFSIIYGPKGSARTSGLDEGRGWGDDPDPPKNWETWGIEDEMRMMVVSWGLYQTISGGIHHQHRLYQNGEELKNSSAVGLWNALIQLHTCIKDNAPFLQPPILGNFLRDKTYINHTSFSPSFFSWELTCCVSNPPEDVGSHLQRWIWIWSLGHRRGINPRNKGGRART